MTSYEQKQGVDKRGHAYRRTVRVDAPSAAATSRVSAPPPPPAPARADGPDLSGYTPTEVDTELALVEARHYEATDALERAERRLASFDEHRAEVFYRSEAALDEERGRYEAAVEGAREGLDAVSEELRPYREEYASRPWTRAYLVTNPGGHVHSTTACSSCFPTTRFARLPEYSGGGEESIVDDAGESACTVCYPSAPVETLARASRIELPDRRAARLEREAAAAARARSKAEKGIVAVDGEPLRVRGWNGFDRLETLHAAKAWLTDAEERMYGKEPDADDVVAVSSAIAAKLGTSAEEEVSAARKRAARRR